MAEKNTERHFLYKNEIAQRYNIGVQTLSKYINRVKDQIPMYVNGQRRFSPVQVKKLDEIFVYGA